MAENISPLFRRINQLERRVEALDAANSSGTLENLGGPGDSGGMDPRVTRLEAHMEHVRTDLAAIKPDVGKLKTDMATLLERVAHLPTKGFIVNALGTALALAAALSVFGPNIRAALGLH